VLIRPRLKGLEPKGPSGLHRPQNGSGVLVMSEIIKSLIWSLGVLVIAAYLFMLS
jgi:hypothetical protein